MPTAVIQCQQVTKHYLQAKSQVTVLNGISFSINEGDTVSIVGASGAGKSTLLNVMGGLDNCDHGSVSVQGKALDTLSDSALAQWRNKHLGFVYQFHHLLGEFSALENVMMPLLISGKTRKQAAPDALAILSSVGLADRQHHRPHALSGGERQRVAIARSLVNRPACVLMDEPTGNLDEATAEGIQALLRELNQTLSISFVLVTHDKTLAQQQNRCFVLRDGLLSEHTDNA